MILDAMKPDHPRTTLLFYAVGDVDDLTREEVKRVIERLRGARSWVIAPPTFVDEVEKAETPDDSDIETLGGALELFSALSSSTLPPSVDRLHFEEVLSVVEAVAELSRKLQIPFEFQLEGNCAGGIENGVADRTLQVGLIDEWRNQLAAAGVL